MALYLYIPPHSCHAPGVLTGLIFGNILRIYQLCSRKRDIDQEIKLFFHRILDRGYQLHKITPIFAKAIENAKRYLSRTTEYRKHLQNKKEEESRQRVFYHLPYHPDNPPSSTIQRLWRKHVSHPIGQIPLNYLKNHEGYPVPIKQLTVCYSRAPNLGNLLSYRKIDKRKGPKVSSLLD